MASVNSESILERIIAVSPLGSETLLILRFDGIENNLKVNDRIPIFLDLDAADLYEADTTSAIKSRQHYCPPIFFFHFFHLNLLIGSSVEGFPVFCSACCAEWLVSIWVGYFSFVSFCFVVPLPVVAEALELSTL